jgi:HAD superfamily hydrolase (TIGR01490 family)
MASRIAAFFDVDGTLTTERVWRGLLDYYKVHKLRRWTSRWFWAYHMPLFFLHKAHLLSQSAFRTPWAAHLLWFLRGETPQAAQPVWDWVTTEYLGKVWRAEGRAKIEEHKLRGDLVVLVSAGPTPLTQRIARELGADLAVGTKPAMSNGHYTGQVDGLVCIDENKAALARQVLAEQQIEVELANSTAYADGGTDIGLLEMVGQPVAFFPDEFLKPIAQQRGWRIIE